MQTSLVQVFLPIALAIIMLGLGLGLTVADFRRVAERPKAAFVALSCQVLILPAVCFALVMAFGLSPYLAVGMMLLAASPGGTSANIFSHLFGGDVALNVTLTAINSFIAAVSLPLIANFSISYFVEGGDAIGLQFKETAQVFAIVLVPVIVGMLIKAKFTRFADRMNKPVKILSAVMLLFILIGAATRDFEILRDNAATVGTLCLIFSVTSLTVGYWAPRIFNVDRRQSIASCMEIGIHNPAIPLAIALSPVLLNNVTMAIPSAVYGAVMYIPALFAGFLLRRSLKQDGDDAGGTPSPSAPAATA
jgi:bile acid:Na+ symporter, BASS family